MNNTINSESLTPIKEFLATKQIALFKTLKQNQFSGQLTITNQDNLQWQFYIYLGRIIYASGGEHPVRRWYRNVRAYLSEIAADSIYLEEELDFIAHNPINYCWEYELLCRWLNIGKINHEQVTKMIMNILIEIFFDLDQSSEVTFTVDTDILIPLSQQICLIEPTQVILLAWQEWQEWLKAKLGDRSPNTAPRIKSREQLKQKISPQMYSMFTILLNGQNTFRDIVVKLQKSLFEVSNILVPYIQIGYIELNSLKDLPSPISATENSIDTLEFNINQNQTSPLVICIDDSILICNIMRYIAKNLGLRFVSVNDPIKAIAQILSYKPDLIFLDLVMPMISGYEICQNIRKLSLFKQTPIIILTANDGVIKRVKTKLLGCSDFITKPVETAKIIEIVRKYLPDYPLTEQLSITNSENLTKVD